MNPPQKHFKILLLGDSCYDYYHYGNVNRISPEAPIPIFDFDHVIKKHGMASNVYENLKTLGVDVHLITSFFENKRRYIDSKTGQQLLRVDENISEERYGNIQDPILSDYDAIVISDYNKGFLSYERIENIIKGFRYGPIFIDTKKSDISRFSGAYIKINELEHNKITSDIPSHSKIITRGGKDVIWNGNSYFPPKVDVHDVCGAGDTFLSALCFEYLQKNDMEKAILFAMKAASITVQKIGVYAPTLQEIEE